MASTTIERDMRSDVASTANNACHEVDTTSDALCMIWFHFRLRSGLQCMQTCGTLIIFEFELREGLGATGGRPLWVFPKRDNDHTTCINFYPRFPELWEPRLPDVLELSVAYSLAPPFTGLELRTAFHGPSLAAFFNCVCTLRIASHEAALLRRVGYRGITPGTFHWCLVETLLGFELQRYPARQ